MSKSKTVFFRRPLIKYFGSKWSLCKYYPKPKYDTIAESCCGGAAYSQQNYDESKVILLNDEDPDVSGLFEWLIGALPSEILQLQCVKLIQGYDLRNMPIPYHAANLIRRWQRVGRNDCWTVSKWNNTPGQWQESVKRSIAESLQYIRNWKVTCGSYESMPDIEATWFVDPPYQHQRGAYKHDAINYGHLAEWCRSRKGQVIVCERLGADWLPFRPLVTLNSGCAHHPQKTMTEVIWTNE